MIIKKKYTTVNNKQEEASNTEESIDLTTKTEEQNTDKEPETQNEKEQDNEQNTNAEKKEEVVEEKKEDIDDLDLTLENIKFESREERREGTRRRGYRRTNDRNLVTRAQQDALTIKEAAKKDGYNEGIQQAQKDLGELKNALAQFFNYKEYVYQKVSECITDIAVEIAKKIVNKTVETDREYIISITKEAISEIGKDENKITLRVMPKDTEIVKDKISEIFSENNAEAKITVVPDNKIKEGGVIIETSNGLIDATIETQLAIIEKALLKKEES